MKEFDAVYERSDSVVSREVSGEVVLVPVRGNVGDLNQIYTLNAVGSEIWQLLDGKRSLGGVIDVLEAEFEVERPSLEGDVLQLIQELRTEGLVREARGE